MIYNKTVLEFSRKLTAEIVNILEPNKMNQKTALEIIEKYAVAYEAGSYKKEDPIGRDLLEAVSVLARGGVDAKEQLEEFKNRFKDGGSMEFNSVDFYNVCRILDVLNKPIDQ